MSKQPLERSTKGLAHGNPAQAARPKFGVPPVCENQAAVSTSERLEVKTTKENVGACIQSIRAVAEAIRELKTVPNGVLYSQLMGILDLATYNRILGVIKNAGLVTESMNVLTWVEPKAEGGAK